MQTKLKKKEVESLARVYYLRHTAQEYTQHIHTDDLRRGEERSEQSGGRGEKRGMEEGRTAWQVAREGMRRGMEGGGFHVGIQMTA